MLVAKRGTSGAIMNAAVTNVMTSKVTQATVQHNFRFTVPRTLENQGQNLRKTFGATLEKKLPEIFCAPEVDKQIATSRLCAQTPEDQRQHIVASYMCPFLYSRIRISMEHNRKVEGKGQQS